MRSLFTLFTAVIICSTAFAQIPNASFESWTTTGGYSTPNGWDNLNSMTSIASVYTCTKGTPGYSGASYLQLTSKTVPSVGVVPGVAVSGVIDMTTFTPKSGFAYTGRPSALTGAWQYMAYGSDQGAIGVMLSKWNFTTHSRDTVAYTLYALPGMVMSWATFSIPLTYRSGALPDSALIVLSSSGTTPVANSYLYVDTLAFSGSVPTGVVTVSNDNNVSVYPNPASGSAYVTYYSAAAGDVRVYFTDINDRVLTSLTSPVHEGENTIPVNLSGMVRGLYFVKIADGQSSQVKKLVIE